MTTIVHLTDLHFGATDKALVQALVAWVREFPPDLVAVSGDLTQGARHAEFRAAKGFLDSLGAPWLAVPGNHDITPYRLGERFLFPYQRWHDEIGAETEPVWQDAQVGVVGLNTARRAGPHLDWSRGRVTRSRLERALAKLDALPAGLTRIVVAHHPLLPPEALPFTTVVGGSQRALAAFGERRVAMVLAGHLHRSYARMARPEGPAPLILQGGSATSTRLRGEPNAFNRIAIDNGAGVIESWAWSGKDWQQAARREADFRYRPQPVAA